MRQIVAVLVGLVLFAVSSFAHQFARGLENNSIVRGDGTPTVIVNGWYVWVVGLIVLVMAFGAAVLLTRAGSGSYCIVVGGSMVALAIAGTIVAVFSWMEFDSLRHTPPLIWLVDGAAAPLTWATIGGLLAVGTMRLKRQTSKRGHGPQ